MGPDETFDIEFTVSDTEWGDFVDGIIRALPKARVKRLTFDSELPWLVTIPEDPTYYRFTHWADAIAFADKEMRK